MKSLEDHNVVQEIAASAYSGLIARYRIGQYYRIMMSSAYRHFLKLECTEDAIALF